MATTMKIGAKPGGSRGRRGAWRGIWGVAVGVIVVVGLLGCSSSKPAYCTDRTNLQNSIKGLTNLNASSGVSGLKSQIQMIQSDATTLVNSAKGDFPSQTRAITSSVDALKSSLAALPSSPSVAQIATVTRDASSVVSSVRSFTDASNSSCS